MVASVKGMAPKMKTIAPTSAAYSAQPCACDAHSSMGAWHSTIVNCSGRKGKRSISRPTTSWANDAKA